jgi:ribonuclease P protein component
VVHQLAGPGGPDSAAGPALVGFVVSRAVGGSVQRNRVHRRLRAVLAAQLLDLPAGSMTVVRALPPAATASYDELVADVTQGLRRVQGQGR